MRQEDPTPREVIDAVRRVNRTVRRRGEHDLRGSGVSFAQLEVMEHLFDLPNLHAGALARRLLITRQSVANLVTKLDEADLIERLPPDGRYVGIRLTPRGERRLRFCLAALRPTLEAASAVSPDVRRCLVDDLHELETALGPPRSWWWLE